MFVFAAWNLSFQTVYEMNSGILIQFWACFCNNIRIQSRRRLGSLSLLLSPFVAVFLLLLAENSVSKQIARTGNYQCGCKCVECCESCSSSDGYACFNSTDVRPCSAYSNCIRHDTQTCGFLYSTVNQVSFCDIKQPPLWPAVLQVPKHLVGDHATFLYTGSEYLSSKTIMDHLLIPEEHVSSKVAESYVKSVVLEEIDSCDEGEIEDQDSTEVEFVDATGALTRGLYEFGVVLGTSAESSETLLIEGAFIPQVNDVSQKLYVLVRDGMQRSGLDAALVKQIGDSITNLTGMAVSNLFVENKFLKSSQDINTIIYNASYPSKTDILGAFDWHSSSEQGLHLDIWVNDTHVHRVMNVPDIQRWSQMINLGVNAYLRRFFGGSVVLAGLKDMPRRRSELQVDFSILFGPLLTMWLMHVTLPVQLYFIVYEKEYGLKIFQYLNGVRPGCHFYAIYVWHLLLYIVCMALLVGLGSILGVKMFALNSYTVQLVFYFLWGIVITSFGFLYATFFMDKRSVALSSVFYILITGFLANVFQVLLIEQDMNILAIVLQCLFPSFCAFRGLYELAAYAFLAEQAGSGGLDWKSMSSDASMMIVLIQLTCQSFIVPALAMYFDRVTGSFDGRKRDPLFFLRTLGSKSIQSQSKARSSPNSAQEDPLDYYLGYFNGGIQFNDNVSRRNSSLDHYLGALTYSKIDSDTASEPKEKDSIGVYSQTNGKDSGSFSVVFQGVRKIFSRDTGDGVHIPHLTIQNNEIFAFLGGSGSYKSTLLKMMQGLIHQDEGVILIQGVDSRDDIRDKPCSGVVFDVDILWGDLSGMENLEFFARVKLGHLVENTQKYVDTIVEVLDLHSSMNKRVSKYSGGTRRRLSLAISLLGYPDIDLLPDIIFMDEPSLSMDPYSRKILWRTLREVREKVAIVVSTSSITEAESCDRICIMKQGHPLYIGSPQHLIYKYGRCMWLSFTTNSTEKNQVLRFVRTTFKDAHLLYDLGQKLKFSIPIESDQTIDSVFRKVEKARIHTLDVLDWSISNSTLEDVYLRLVD